MCVGLFCGRMYSVLLHIPRSGIAGSNGRLFVEPFEKLPKLISKLAVPFYSPISIITRVLIFTCLHQHLLKLSVFKILVILVGMNLYLIVGMICSSLMTSDIFLCVYHPFVVFLWRNVFQILGPFFSWAICCLFCCIFHFLESSLLSAIRFAHVFSHFVSCLCPLLIVSFETQKFLIVMKLSLSDFLTRFFLMSGVLFDVISKKPLPLSKWWRVIPMFLS